MPPEILLPGAKQSQEVKCLALGYFVMSVPHSLISFTATYGPKFHRGHIRTQAVDLSQVDAEQGIQSFSDIKLQTIGGVPLLDPRWRQRRLGCGGIGTQLRQCSLDFVVAFGHLNLVEVIPGQSLRQGEHVFALVVAHQGLADGLGRSLAAHVSIPGQLLGVGVARNDGPDDAQPRRTGHIRHHVVELHVHLRQRLLHVLNVGRGVVQQPSVQRTPLAHAPLQGASNTGIELRMPTPEFLEQRHRANARCRLQYRHDLLLDGADTPATPQSPAWDGSSRAAARIDAAAEAAGHR